MSYTNSLPKLPTLLTAVFLALPYFADASIITGGSTSIDITLGPSLATAGVILTPVGPGTLDPTGGVESVALATFPVASGIIDDATGDATILHSGGLTLSSNTGRVALTDVRVIENIVTNVGIVTVTANVNGGNSLIQQFPLFRLGEGMSLIIPASTANLLTQILGVPDLTEATFGTATPSFQVAAVPEPISMFSATLGLAITFISSRKRQKQQRFIA